MYFFLILGLPLGFVLLVLGIYPSSERPQTGKAFARGLAAFVPIWLAARLLGLIVPTVYGSPLLALHEWADRILPYSALPALAYLAFYKPGERMPAGAARRRLTAFYAGSLAPVGLCETLRAWGNPEPYALFLLPILLAAICLAMPRAATLLRDGYGFGLAAAIAGLVLASLAASLLPYLLLARLWPVALLVAGAAGAGAWLFAEGELRARPPASFA